MAFRRRSRSRSRGFVRRGRSSRVRRRRIGYRM